MSMLVFPLNRRYALYTSLFIVSLFFIYIWRLPGYSSLPSPATSHKNEIGSGKTSEDLKPAEPQFRPGVAKPPGQNYTRTLVMAKTKKEDITWLQNRFPNENLDIYMVDDPPETLRIPMNKGKESMVYITYLIDNYYNLPDISLFFHPHQIAWHNNEIMGQDTARMLENINNNHIARVGYMPARCKQDPGCPHWLRFDLLEKAPEELDEYHRLEEKYFTSKIWNELHPTMPVPEYLSAPCCSQFGVSRERILSQPRAEYVRWREWLINTDLNDEIAGRWFEYGWHILFTGEAEFCPSQNSCYCDGYGICFGGDKQFDSFLEREKKKGEMFTVADQLSRDGGDANEINQLRSDAFAIHEELEREKEAAVERGKDPKNRALDCGRPWKEGDGF